MIKAWKILHKPTGLYYNPTRHKKLKLSNGRSRYFKTNLTKNGKTYSQKPSLKHLCGIYWPFLEKDKQIVKTTILDEFEIIEL